MKATFSSEQIELQRVITSIADSGLEDARACTSETWQPFRNEDQLLENFGSLGVDESAGGVGGGLLDAAIAAEALGRTVVPSRFVPHLAALYVAHAAGIDIRAATNNGERWTLATEESRGRGPDTWETSVLDRRASLEKTFVPLAFDADKFVVVGKDGVALLAREDVRPAQSIDFTRPVSTVKFSASPLAVGPLKTGLLRANVLVAAELCGVAMGAVTLGAQFAAVREQFGQPIGARQGVAFQLSEALVGVRAAWDLTVYAAWAAESTDPDAAVIVSQAKERAGRSAVFAAERAIQVHGGMGITFEADPHLYLRRALFDDAWLGTGQWHRRRIGRWRVHEWSESATLQR